MDFKKKNKTISFRFTNSEILAFNPELHNTTRTCPQHIYQLWTYILSINCTKIKSFVWSWEENGLKPNYTHLIVCESLTWKWFNDNFVKLPLVVTRQQSGAFPTWVPQINVKSKLFWECTSSIFLTTPIFLTNRPLWSQTILSVCF